MPSEGFRRHCFAGLRPVFRLHAVGQKLPDVTRFFHFTSRFPCFVAVTPEIIHAHRAFNRAAGILRHNQAVEGFAGNWVGGGDK